MAGAQARLTATEQATHELYGALWPEFDEELYEQSISLFGARLAANDIDLQWFNGKRCLDAGCGGGRYTIAMSRLGASEVVGVDIGAQGLAAARERAAARGVTDVHFQRSSVLDLPFESDSFDFACSNGVLHHTEDPDRGLAELLRVLRPGGKLFLYVFGDGGVFWQQTGVLRSLLHDAVDLKFAQDILRLMGIPANRRFNFLDISYVPIQRRYTRDNLERKLTATGFTSMRWLPRGISYDTNHKIDDDPMVGRLIFGEGDLRVLAEKPNGT